MLPEVRREHNLLCPRTLPWLISHTQTRSDSFLQFFRIYNWWHDVLFVYIFIHAHRRSRNSPISHWNLCVFVWKSCRQETGAHSWWNRVVVNFLSYKKLQTEWSTMRVRPGNPLTGHWRRVLELSASTLCVFQNSSRWSGETKRVFSIEDLTEKKTCATHVVTSSGCALSMWRQLQAEWSTMRSAPEQRSRWVERCCLHTEHVENELFVK